MKSLLKTLDILEYVVLCNGKKVTPSETAAALGIHPVTCTRILGELTRRGYLIQVSRKEGYLPGPMIPSLGTRRNGYERMAAASRIPIAELSETLGCQVNIAVLHLGGRIMLNFHLSDRDMKPWDHFVFTDHWETATGRLLIAAQEDREARKLTAAAGIVPYPKKELETIRANGFVRFEHAGLVIIGHWVRIPEYPVAAFGFGVEANQADEAFQRSEETAKRIREQLIKPNQAY